MFTPPPDVLRDSFFWSPESLALSSVLAEWRSQSLPCLGVNVDIVILINNNIFFFFQFS